MRIGIEKNEREDQKGFRRIWIYETINGKEYKTFCGLIDQSGNQLTPCMYHNILGFYHDNPLACVELNHKWGYINDRGNLVVSCQYDFAEDMFYCGLATVQKDEKWGCIDGSGKLVIPLIYDEPIFFYDHLAGVKRTGKCGCINTKGDAIIDFKYDYCGVMGANRICVKQFGKYGIIDYKGNTITPCVYDGISDIRTGNRIEYKKGEEHGFMDLNGSVIQILPF